MKVCFALLYYDHRRAYDDPAPVLARMPFQREVPRWLAARGHRVDVVLASPRDLEHREHGVRYRFVAAPWPARAAARVGAAVLRRGRAELEAALSAVDGIASPAPDVVHFHGTTLHLNLALLARRLRPETALVLHHHGGALASRGWARRLQLRGLRRAARLLVTARAHGEPFVAAGALCAEQVVELPETSSRWCRRPREEARRETGMTGDPVFLCAARLHPVKDPFTVLRGFERIAAARPGARLYLCYLSDELGGETRAWLAARPELAARVELRGLVPPAAMEAVFNSADFLLQASRREWSGIAVIDAMACGVVPVVTDIPSLRALTGGHGLLFPVGDDEALARQVLSVTSSEIAARSRAVRRHFDEELAFPRLARRLEEVYAEIGA